MILITDQRPTKWPYYNVSICFKGREVGQRFKGPQTLLFFTQKMMMMILWRPRKKTSSTSSSGGSSWSVVRPRPLFAAALLSDALHTTLTIFEKVNGGRRRLEEEEDEERRRPRKGSKALKSKVTLWTRDLLLFSYTGLGSLIGITQCGNFRRFFSHSDFRWNQFWLFWSLGNRPFWPFEHLWFLNFLRISHTYVLSSMKVFPKIKIQSLQNC